MNNDIIAVGDRVSWKRYGIRWFGIVVSISGREFFVVPDSRRGKPVMVWADEITKECG